MKIMRFAAMLALLMSGSAAPTTAAARAAEQFATGSFKFSLEGDYAKYVEFDARALADGAATGQMFFSDEAPLVIRDVDGTGDPEDKQAGFYIKAELDGMLIERNRAVMSGVVADSSLRDLIGQRVLLTVEDNGDNTKEPDKVTWGVYRPADKSWQPSDGELEKDPGVGLTWWATDAERKDDVGYRMPRDASPVGVGTFPVLSYDFPVVAYGVGDIVVRP
jgi:hypothetical protein